MGADRLTHIEGDLSPSAAACRSTTASRPTEPKLRGRWSFWAARVRFFVADIAGAYAVTSVVVALVVPVGAMRPASQQGFGERPTPGYPDACIDGPTASSGLIPKHTGGVDPITIGSCEAWVLFRADEALLDVRRYLALGPVTWRALARLDPMPILPLPWRRYVHVSLDPMVHPRTARATYLERLPTSPTTRPGCHARRRTRGAGAFPGQESFSAGFRSAWPWRPDGTRFMAASIADHLARR